MVSLRLTISVLLTFAIAFTGSLSFAAEVSGKITLKKVPAHDRVSAAIYDLRGVSVAPAAPVSKSSPYRFTAIWLESSGPQSASQHPVIVQMRQSGRSFQPDMLVVPVGSTVEFPNLDPIFHNIFSLSRAQAFDLGYYSQGKSRNIVFSRTGVVQVYCHIHSEMYGAIVVVPNQWFTVPDSDGEYTIPDVPPGDYRLMAWKRSTGLFRKKLHIAAGAGTTHLSLMLPEEQAE